MTIAFEFIGEDQVITQFTQNLDKSKSEFLSELSARWFDKVTTEAFEKQEDRETGEKWQRLSDITIADRLARRGGKYGKKSKYGKTDVITKQQIESERGNMQILQDTGQLKRSFRPIKRDDDTVVWGTTISYAWKHQFGDPDNVLNGEPAEIP
ncbi:MAG: hypothetical protein DRP08_08030, partial [Candidatus Aenigmatarchaeota archaeon]